MDDVADLLDELPEEARNALSYGELLSKVGGPCPCWVCGGMS